MDDEIVLNYVYRYRGYSGDFGITREELKTQMSLRLGKYVDGIFGVLAEAQKSNPSFTGIKLLPAMV